MIQEAYCSFEVAKLLKEKGFDESIFEYYVGNKDNVQYARNKDGFRPSELPDEYYLHITHQMAMAWLREVYGIDIVIEISDPSVKDRKYYCIIWNKNNDSYILDLFSSYEEAVEAALKYCLENLI